MSPLSNPPTSITPTNQNGVIAIITGFSLCLVLLSVGVRMYAKRYASAFRWDDVTFYITAVLGLAQISVGLYMVAHGLGKTVEELGMMNFSKIRKVGIFFSSCSSGMIYMAWLVGWRLVTDEV